jgi:hypothetical protein
MSSETVHDFQWDPSKALYNARKHGVTFDEAATVFLDALALTVYDEANSQNEDRWFTLGHFGRSSYLRCDWPDKRSGAHHFGPRGYETLTALLRRRTEIGEA